jgi:hypothetical protein
MEILNNVKPLSPKLQVAPLKDGEVAVFRLKRAFLKDGLHEDPTCPEVAQYSGVENVNDIGEKGPARSKTIGTVIIDHKQVQNQLKPIYEPIKFIRGYKRVGSADHGMYEMLMRSKKSGANRYRKLMGAKGEPEWELVGADQVVSQLAIEQLRFEAEKLVRGANITELQTIAVKLNSSPDQRLHISSFKPGVKVEPQALKLELIQKAKTYYKQVVYASDDAAAKKQVEVYDGIMYGILYNEPSKGYQLTVEDDVINLVTPEPGKDPIESLIEYFESEKGAKNYLLFVTALKKALKITA